MWILEKYRPVWAPEGSSGGSSAPGSTSGGSGGGTSSGASAPSSAPSSPSGGASSKSTTPAESPVGAREAQPSSDDTFSGEFSFDSIFSDGGEGSPPPSGGEAPAAAPPTVPPQTTQAPAAAAPAAEPTVAPVAAPAAATEAPAAPGASPPPAPSAQLDPFNPGQLANHLVSVEREATDFVAQQMFQLTPEDREAIETDVVGHIPKLLARVFVKSQQNVLQQLDRLIPTMVQRHTQAMKRNSEGEDKFYDRWKNIGREHSNLVNSYATAYRQMHPTATLDEMIEQVGPIVMMAARIAPPSAEAPAAGQPAGHAPKGANGRPPQPAPFVPAGSGSGPASQPKTNELNPWEAMFVGRE